jgi:hypothetical protein
MDSRWISCGISGWVKICASAAGGEGEGGSQGRVRRGRSRVFIRRSKLFDRSMETQDHATIKDGGEMRS